MKIEAECDSFDSNKKNPLLLEQRKHLKVTYRHINSKVKKACVPKIWINNLTRIFNESGLFGAPLATWLNSTILFTIVQSMFAYLFAVGIS